MGACSWKKANEAEMITIVSTQKESAQDYKRIKNTIDSDTGLKKSQ